MMTTDHNYLTADVDGDRFPQEDFNKALDLLRLTPSQAEKKYGPPPTVDSYGRPLL